MDDFNTTNVTNANAASKTNITDMNATDTNVEENDDVTNLDEHSDQNNRLHISTQYWGNQW